MLRKMVAAPERHRKQEQADAHGQSEDLFQSGPYLSRETMIATTAAMTAHIAQ